MAKPSHPKGKKTSAPLPKEIIEIINILQSGAIASWKIKNSTNDMIKFRCSLENGQTIIIEKINAHHGLDISPQKNGKLSVDDRRRIVMSLRLKGFTQAQIADQIGHCQKTISNDCKILNL